jgi:predicted PurR-regulated permease PerM
VTIKNEMPTMIQPATPVDTGRWTGQRVVLTTLGALLVGLGFWLVFRFYYVAFILFAALVLGTAIRPAVDWLHRRKLPGGLSVIVVYLALLVLVIGFVLLLAPLLVAQSRAIIAELPAYYLSLRAWLAGSSSALLQRLALQLPAAFAFSLPGETSGDLPFGALGQALGYVGMVWRTLFIGVAILALAFYWTLNGERMIRLGMLRFPAERREGWHQLIWEMETKVGAYMRGVAILSLVVGVLATIAYVLIGLPSALVLGLLAGVFEAVPVIGPVLGAILPVLLALSIAPGKVIWVVLATVLIQQAEGQLLVPRVMDKAVGVSPIVTILAIVAFSTLFGLPGAVLAIPLAALIQILLNYVVTQHEVGQLARSEGREPIDALRYQAQELLQDVRTQMRYKTQMASDKEDNRIEDMVEVAALGLDAILAQAVETQRAK